MGRSRRIGLSVLAFALLVGIAGLSSQQAPSPSTFRAGVELVEVDVAVLDKDRKSVRGLTAADFTIFEDKKPRRVAAFTAVDLPGRAIDVPGAPWMKDVSPDVTTNVLPEEGRLIVILMDYTIPHGWSVAAAKGIARAAVREMGPGDLAAIVHTLEGELQDFTNDRARLMATINGSYPTGELSDAVQERLDSMTADRVDFFGQPLSPMEPSLQCYCGVCTHEAITRIADAVRDIPRRRKSLMFVGSRIVMDTTSSRCGGRVKAALDAMYKAVDLSGLTVHSLDARGLETLAATASSRAPGDYMVRSRGNTLRQGTLFLLPDRTGGRVVKNTNAPDARVAAIMQESDSYYLLGFEPAARGDGGRHEISVKVNRRNLDVRARRAFLASPATPPAPDPKGPANAALQDTLFKRNGVMLSAIASAFPGATAEDGVVTLTIGANHDAAIRPSSTTPERVAVMTRVLKMTGETISTRSLTVVLTPERAGSAPTYEIVQRFSLKPGRYEIRVAVDDAARRQSGSVYTFVNVPDFKKLGLFLSDVALHAGTARPVAMANLADVLPFTPTATREFDKTERVQAFLQIHADRRMAAPLSLTAFIVDAREQKRFEQPRVFAASDFDATRQADYLIDLPLRDLDPGQYLLTIEGRSGTATAKRQVRFSVR